MRPFGRNNKLVSLTPAQVEQVASWLLDEKLTYRQVVARLEETFGFSVCLMSISHFWHRECVPRKLLRSAEVAKSIETASAAIKEDWQGANAQLLGQRIFETLASPEVDLKTVAALGNILEKVKGRAFNEKKLKAQIATEKRRVKQRDRQLALAREKFEFSAVDAALSQAPAIREITADEGLSGEEKREQVRRLLFPQAFEEKAECRNAEMQKAEGRMQNAECRRRIAEGRMLKAVGGVVISDR